MPFYSHITNTNSKIEAERTMYASYTHRVKSFENATPLIRRKARQMAKSGLYYGKKSDTVYCTDCYIKISDWKWSDSPAKVHKKGSPLCKWVIYELDTEKLFNGRLLVYEIRNTWPKLTPFMFFQAVSRLKHYLMFPYIEIEDIEIDLGVSEVWHSAAGALWKKAYKDTHKTMPPMDKNIQRMNIDLHIASPIQWYMKAINVKHFKLTGTFEHVPSTLQMRDSWKHMTVVQRYKYIKLNRLDQKRTAAQSIEDAFSVQKLDIGFMTNSYENIVVSLQSVENRCVTVSSMLADKSSRLFLEDV